MRIKKTLAHCLCGVFCGLFFIFGNLIPPIGTVGGVPITLQTAAVAMCGYTLGVGYSLLTLCCVFVMTLCGIPMMSGFSAGPAAFVGPSGGYITGWLPLIALIGLGGTLSRRQRGAAARLAVALSLGITGLAVDYALGAAWLSVSSSEGLSGFTAYFISSVTVFLIPDIIKLVLGLLAAGAVERALVRRGC